MKKIFFVTIFLALSSLIVWQASKIKLVRSSLSVRNLIGEEAYKDKFPIVFGDVPEDLAELADIKGEEDDSELILNKGLIELPLVSYDYYYGKHINAAAAANEINYIGILEPGDRIRVISDGYVTFSGSRGYISPGSGFMYASGVCWASSTLGTLMDEANRVFNRKYDMPLFIFYYGDRSPHPHYYSTYRNSNYGYGYAVVRHPGGSTADYKFTVNPELKNIPKFENLKIKIVMVARTDNPDAFLGQSIGGYLKSNVDF
jgi:hypothetical protein